MANTEFDKVTKITLYILTPEGKTVQQTTSVTWDTILDDMRKIVHQAEPVGTILGSVWLYNDTVLASYSTDEGHAHGSW